LQKFKRSFTVILILSQLFRRIYYQFSFEYTFEYDIDKVWFAYAIPYTYTMQNNFIKQIEEI